VIEQGFVDVLNVTQVKLFVDRIIKNTVLLGLVTLFFNNFFNVWN